RGASRTAAFDAVIVAPGPARRAARAQAQADDPVLHNRSTGTAGATFDAPGVLDCPLSRAMTRKSLAPVEPEPIARLFRDHGRALGIALRRGHATRQQERHLCGKPRREAYLPADDELAALVARERPGILQLHEAGEAGQDLVARDRRAGDDRLLIEI